MEGFAGKRRLTGRFPADPPLAARIAEVAGAQHAVIALDQLVEQGLSRSAVRSRVTAGSLHRVHSGVLSLVPARLLTRDGRFMAAVLACGDGAALSHRSAACHRGLRDDNRPTIDVTSPARRGQDIDAISPHSGATLLPRDVEIVDAIPCTTLARTLLDLADVVNRRSVERAIDRAEILRVLDMPPIEDVLQRANGRRGAATLKHLLSAMQFQSTTTKNELEEAFLTICRDIEHPPDAVNAWIAYPEGGGAEADFLWHEQRLIVEVDGRDVHTTHHAFEHDRRRDQRLNLLGWRVVRFTWRQVEHEPATVAATLKALLER
jgi:predicted transcriptional regulator of viral defense system